MPGAAATRSAAALENGAQRFAGEAKALEKGGRALVQAAAVSIGQSFFGLGHAALKAHSQHALCQLLLCLCRHLGIGLGECSLQLFRHCSTIASWRRWHPGRR